MILGFLSSFEFSALHYIHFVRWVKTFLCMYVKITVFFKGYGANSALSSSFGLLSNSGFPAFCFICFLKWVQDYLLVLKLPFSFPESGGNAAFGLCFWAFIKF